MNTYRPNSLAIALPLLLGLMLYAPAFFGEQAYSFVLGIDQIAAQGISWKQPLGAIVQNLLDTLAYLNPTSLRLAGLIGLGLATAMLVAGLSRSGVHPAGAGLAGAILITHPAAIAAVMKLDNTGLAIALIALVAVATRWANAPFTNRLAFMILAPLAHPIGVCAWPLAWLMQKDDQRPELLKPIYLAAFVLSFVSWLALTPMDAAHLLALAGQTWINLFSGWRIGEFLPWAPEIAAARLDLAGASGLLTVLFFVFTGAVALLERFGHLLAEPMRRFLPLAVIAPLTTGLMPTISPVHADPAYALPLVIGLAILIGSAVGPLVQRALTEDNLVAAIIQTSMALLLTSGFFFAAGADQVRIFQDGQVFWKTQRGRHDAAPQSRLGYARATLFLGSDPRSMRNGQVELRPALKAAEILDNLFESLDDGPGLTAEQEAEAHWLFSVAVTPHFANEFTSAIKHLEEAIKLLPNEAFYAEALERAQRDQVEYQKVITGCLTADDEQLQARRKTLMKQAESLAKAGLIDATIEKYRDAIRCAPSHRDGYQYLSRSLSSVGRHNEAIKILNGLPPNLQVDLSLIEQKAFIIQNLPSPEGVETKQRLAWRAQQRAKAHPIWLDVAQKAPERPMAWLNLAENALLDGSGPALAKAYLNKAISDRPALAAKGRVRQLKDKIDSQLKPDTPLPEINLNPTEPTADAGPNDSGVIP